VEIEMKIILGLIALIYLGFCGKGLLLPSGVVRTGEKEVVNSVQVRIVIPARDRTNPEKKSEFSDTAATYDSLKVRMNNYTPLPEQKTNDSR
jgi:hypothetical protein